MSWKELAKGESLIDERATHNKINARTSINKRKNSSKYKSGNITTRRNYKYFLPCFYQYKAYVLVTIYFPGNGILCHFVIFHCWTILYTNIFILQTMFEHGFLNESVPYYIPHSFIFYKTTLIKLRYSIIIFNKIFILVYIHYTLGELLSLILNSKWYLSLVN